MYTFTMRGFNHIRNTKGINTGILSIFLARLEKAPRVLALIEDGIKDRSRFFTGDSCGVTCHSSEFVVSFSVTEHGVAVCDQDMRT